VTTGDKRLAWYVTITLVMGGATVFAALALGLLVAWMIEHPPAVTFAACWVLSVFVAVGMAALWGDV